MTQHYKAIAEIINDMKLDGYMPRPAIELQVREQVGGKLADYFAADNPRFDREKFLEACGL